jgi:hypothetical protein
MTPNTRTLKQTTSLVPNDDVLLTAFRGILPWHAGTRMQKIDSLLNNQRHSRKVSPKKDFRNERYEQK